MTDEHNPDYFVEPGAYLAPRTISALTLALAATVAEIDGSREETAQTFLERLDERIAHMPDLAPELLLGEERAVQMHAQWIRSAVLAFQEESPGEP